MKEHQCAFTHTTRAKKMRTHQCAFTSLIEVGYRITNNHNVVLVHTHTQIDRSAKGKPRELRLMGRSAKGKPRDQRPQQVREMGRTTVTISDGRCPAIRHRSAHSSRHEHHKVNAGSTDSQACKGPIPQDWNGNGRQHGGKHTTTSLVECQGMDGGLKLKAQVP